MPGKENGFAHLLLILLVLASLIVAAVAYKTFNNDESTSFFNKNILDNNPQDYDQYAKYDLPECQKQKFTHSIVDPKQIDTITPLGTFTPPDHTLPTEHVYINLTDTGNYIDMTEVYSPGEIYITEISRQKGAVPHLGPVEDYAISFSICEHIHGYIGHIIELSDELKSKVDFNDCRSYMASGSEFEYCETYLDETIKLKSGEIIGMVGKPRSRNFDLGLFDTTYTNLFANPEPYKNSRTPHIICPLDVYVDPIKKVLFEKLDRTDNSCGTINYDVPGTLAGNWFYQKVDVTNPEQWKNHLVFGYDNEDPSYAVISIGGTFSDAGKIEFQPKDEGTINRRFNEVTPDGLIYCYQTEQRPNRNLTLQGKILVKLSNEEELMVEHKDGDCTANETFTQPYTYSR